MTHTRHRLAVTALTGVTLLLGGVSDHPPRPAPHTLAVVPAGCSQHRLAGVTRGAGDGCRDFRGDTSHTDGVAPEPFPPSVAPTVVQRRTVRLRASRTTTRPPHYRANPATRPAHTGAPGRPVTVPPAPVGPGVAAVIRYALDQVGDRYVWGAAGHGAYDCSGLVMAAYAHAGVHLPHSSTAIAGTGRRVNRGELRPGDVLGYRGHVALYLGGGRMVEAANPRAGIRVARLRTPAWVRREL